jgi:hypothetical protein
MKDLKSTRVDHLHEIIKLCQEKKTFLEESLEWCDYPKQRASMLHELDKLGRDLMRYSKELENLSGKQGDDNEK